jgi:hypothetical protein
MGKFIKKVTAQRCPIHQAVLEECGQQLVEKGYFNKANIIDKLKFQAVEDSIRWDYIAAFLSTPELGHDFQLVPLAQRFFKSTKAERERAAKEVDAKGRPVNFGQYLAGGHGKKTAGYARVTFEGGLLALKKAQNYAGMRNGVGEAFEKYRRAVLADRGLRDDVRDHFEELSDKEAA